MSGSETRDFLAALLARAEDKHFLEVRQITPSGRVAQDFLRIDLVRRAGLPLRFLSRDGTANFYYGVAPRVRPGGKAQDCGHALAVWADFDHGPPAAVPLATSLVVETSSNKFQVLWLLNHPCADLAAIEGVNRAIALGYGADPNACDRARVLRLPGFVNLKYQDKPRARLLVCKPDVRYTIAQLVAAFPLVRATATAKMQTRHHGDAPAYLTVVYDAIVEELERRGLRWRPNGGGILCQCPFDGSGAGDFSMSIHPVRGWKDFGDHGAGRLTLLAHKLGIRLLEGAGHE